MLVAGNTLGRGGPCLSVHEGEAQALRVVRAALEAGLWPVVAVVGDRADEVRAALAGLPVATVADAGFARGPGSSIRLGLRRVTECAPAARGVVLIGCGSPGVDARQLRTLSAAAGREGAVAAMRSAGAVGLPAFFPAARFVELATLADGEGCGELLARHAADLIPVDPMLH